VRNLLKEIETSIKLSSPILLEVIQNTLAPTAFENWRKAGPEIRENKLKAEIAELERINSDLRIQLTEYEKFSSISGFNNTLNEYMGTPFEDKLEYLLNALLNGCFGNFDLELREQFYKWVVALQPTDIRILKYLTEKVPDNWNLDTNLIDQTISIRAIKSALEIPDEIIRMSIDRLRANGLIFNPIAVAGTASPYFDCFPVKAAWSFLNFLGEFQLNRQLGNL